MEEVKLGLYKGFVLSRCISFISNSRTAMAAAAGLARSKGVSRVAATKGLLIVFTLLCVGVSGSLIDKKQLAEVRENVQKLQQEAVRWKADHMLDSAYIPNLLDDVILLMDPLSEKIDTRMTDFPPLMDLMDDLNSFLEASKKYIDKYHETAAAKIKDYEEKLNSVMEQITYLENHKNEL